jgi:hypothetical protein
MEDLDDVFEGLEDPRTRSAKRHLLHEVLMIALCTVPRRPRRSIWCQASLAKPSRPSASMPSCAVTGESRMGFTGCSTWSWMRIRQEIVRTTAHKTWRCCASLPSISPSSNPQRSPCAESSSKQDGTTPSSPKSCSSSQIFKCDSPGPPRLYASIQPLTR